ncbi:MAG: 50S ribosomal protein L5 [Candidatus Dojkabacteria bacterium]|nr:MAG: 50S ribosomal protein L5 [Candidatus Dojkabacteria bacterium]
MQTLKERFTKDIAPKFHKAHSIANVSSIPTPQKITLNIGLGEALKDAGIIDALEKDLTLIAGQKPVRTRARKSIADFSLQKGAVIGLKVTLRRDKMWHFLDKLINIVLPRVKDFRGISGTAFDNRGNYTLGMPEHTVFAEIDPAKVTKTKGLSIGIAFNTEDANLNKTMMRELGFIFKEE